ncbi:MAG: ywbF [Haloplasmataceae bacterium]|jgi:PPP family 3-phenylpropionic acid transporter|nr:ywbF [Haloplasmataceae bacterium]
MNSKNKKIKLLRDLSKKNLLIYKIYYFSFFFAQGAYLSLYTSYLRNVAKITPSLIGTILSISPLISILFQPIWALINEKFNLDKKVVIFSVLMVNIVTILILLSYEISVIIVFLSIYTLILMLNTIYGIFVCSIGPIHDSLTVLYTKKYGFKYGDVRIWGSIGYAIAAFITGKLVDVYGYNIIIIFCTIFYLISIISFIKMKQIRAPKINKNIDKESNLLSIFKNKTFVVFLIFSALSLGVLSATGSYLFLYIQEKGGTEDVIGLSTSLLVGLEILFMMIVLKFNTRFSDFSLLITAIILQVPVLIIFIFCNNLNVLIFALLLRGASQGMYVPVLVNFISSLLPTRQISSGLTLYSALSIGLTGFTTLIVGGFLIETFSYSTFFIIMLVLVVISLIFGFILSKVKKQIIVQL